MGKNIQISEQQYQKLKQHVLIESTTSPDNKFKTKVPVVFELNEKNVDGRYVYGVLDIQIVIEFTIDIYYKSYGIDSIFIYGFSGPKTMQVELELEALTDDDNDEIVAHQFNLDWSVAELDTDECRGKKPLGVQSVVITLDNALLPEKISIIPYCD